VTYRGNRMCSLEAQEEFAKLIQEGALRALTRRYCDTALSANAPALAALGKFMPPTQIRYGSDFPLAVGMMKKTIEGLAIRDFTPERRVAVARGNATAPFPRRYTKAATATPPSPPTT
jgi:hypothetical protein